MVNIIMALYRTLPHDLVKNEIGEKRKMNQANVENVLLFKSEVLQGRRVVMGPVLLH